MTIITLTYYGKLYLISFIGDFSNPLLISTYLSLSFFLFLSFFLSLSLFAILKCVQYFPRLSQSRPSHLVTYRYLYIGRIL